MTLLKKAHLGEERMRAKRESLEATHFQAEQ
jgi:hypothetical protein